MNKEDKRNLIGIAGRLLSPDLWRLSQRQRERMREWAVCLRDIADRGESAEIAALKAKLDAVRGTVLDIYRPSQWGCSGCANGSECYAHSQDVFMGVVGDEDDIRKILANLLVIIDGTTPSKSMEASDHQ